MLSVIIPSRNEPYLTHTVNDLLSKAKGEIEIIVILDGYWADPMPVNDKRVIVVHRGQARGMRDGINSGVAIAKGEHIMKCDAHCMFDEGFDVKLIADCESNWVAVQRRKRLDAEQWSVIVDDRADIDYSYLSNPYKRDTFGRPKSLYGIKWEAMNRREDLKAELISDTMTAQGSCWFMHKDYFYQLELLDAQNYGSFFGEFLEIALKCWLSGGRVITNKKTWYAHMHKSSRGYSLKTDLAACRKHILKWMTFKAAWDKQTLPIEWLIDKFKPVPGWDK